MEPFEIDDGRRDDANGPVWRRVRLLALAVQAQLRPFHQLLPRLPRSPLSAIAFPFHLLVSLTRFVLGILRLPVHALRFTYLQLFRPPAVHPISRRGPDWWVTALEEETGAVCIGHEHPRAAAVSGVSAGPSSLTPRFSGNGENATNRKVLPDFSLESYEEVLRVCEAEARIACIVLVCEEHDDVADFKRTTLTNSDFVRTLYENDVLVWGGDVRTQDAWSASQKLQATTYPFVAFLALQPARHSTNDNAAPKLVVLSRHQGPAVPATAPTSPQSLLEHLRQQLIPRVKPFLERIRTVRRRRDQERLLRDEQDRAFRDAARRDKEKIEARLAAERREAEERRARERELLLEEARRQKEMEDANERKRVRMEWRRWTRRTLAPPADVQKPSRDSIRIAFRLPGDKQSRRQFSSTATLTSLYAFVDAQLIPPDLPQNEDPDVPPIIGQSSKDTLQQLEEHIVSNHQSADEWWGFKLVFAYPRQEIKWEKGKSLCDVDVLKGGGGQIMVEMLEHHSHNANLTDEYDSDDDGK